MLMQNTKSRKQFRACHLQKQKGTEEQHLVKTPEETQASIPAQCNQTYVSLFKKHNVCLLSFCVTLRGIWNKLWCT